jgi:hypothetical protein
MIIDDDESARDSHVDEEGDSFAEYYREEDIHVILCWSSQRSEYSRGLLIAPPSEDINVLIRHWHLRLQEVDDTENILEASAFRQHVLETNNHRSTNE